MNNQIIKNNKMYLCIITGDIFKERVKFHVLDTIVKDIRTVQQKK